MKGRDEGGTDSRAGSSERQSSRLYRHERDGYCGSGCSDRDT